MEKVRDAANTKIRAILTEKQQVAYTKFLTDEGKKPSRWQRTAETTYIR
jgi:hypothetical protein